MIPDNSLSDSQSPNQPPAEPAPGSTRGKRHRFWRWFWLTFLVVSLAYAWYCFYVPANNIAWADDYAAAQRQAVQSDEPIILFFTGKWCVPCRIMKRNVWADDLVADTVNANFVPVMIDVDDPGAADAVRRYSVGSTPKTVITDPEGNVLRQKEGGMSKMEFLGLLQPVNRADSNEL